MIATKNVMYFSISFIFTILVAPICGTSEDDCHRYATCTDTGPAKYLCKCNEGYTGDGKNCTG